MLDTKVTVAQLRRIPVPKERPYSYGKSSDSWSPIQHGEFASEVFRALHVSDARVKFSEWFVARSDNAVIGVIAYTGPKVRCKTPFARGIVVRNSNDGFWAPTAFPCAIGWRNDRHALVLAPAVSAGRSTMDRDVRVAVDAIVAQAVERRENPLALGYELIDRRITVSVAIDHAVAMAETDCYPWRMLAPIVRRVRAVAGKNKSISAWELFCAVSAEAANRSAVDRIETLIRLREHLCIAPKLYL